MSTIEGTSLSTKGQVVIPQLIRDHLGIKLTAFPHAHGPGDCACQG